jgi:hypothetical protein
LISAQQVRSSYTDIFVPLNNPYTAYAFELMHRRRFLPPNDVKRYGLVCVAPKASYFEIRTARIDSIADRWRWLCWTFVAKHSTVPCPTGKLVGFLARLPGTFCRHLDISAVEIFARLGRRAAIKATVGRAWQIIDP